jgi:hypothetical protein
MRLRLYDTGCGTASVTCIFACILLHGRLPQTFRFCWLCDGDT